MVTTKTIVKKLDKTSSNYLTSAKANTQGEEAVLKAISLMTKEEQTLAKKFHSIVKENAPMLVPRTWYGMPAYSNADGKVVCFFQNGSKFKTRYSTIGFQEAANLDNGYIWPVAFAVLKLEASEQEKIIKLVKQAIVV